MFGYFNMEEQLDFIRQEERAEGRAEGLAEGRAEGRTEGRTEGAAMLGTLITKLLSIGRTDDVARAAQDASFREELYKEFQLVQQ